MGALPGKIDTAGRRRCVAAVDLVGLQEVRVGVAFAAEVEANLSLGGGRIRCWIAHGFTGSLDWRACIWKGETGNRGRQGAGGIN